MSDSNVCPESTIESANRRKFIKKAALVAAVAGVGSTFLEKSVSLVPESSADSRGTRGNTPKNSQSSTIVTSTVSSNRVGNLAIFGTPRCYCNIGFTGTEITGACNAFCPEPCCSNSCGGGPSAANLSGSVSGYCGPGSCNCGYPCTPNSLAVLNVTNAFSKGSASCPSRILATGVSAVTEGVAHPIPPGAVGVLGVAKTGAGLLGQSSSGPGVSAISGSPITGVFKNSGSSTNKTAGIQIQNGCSTPVAWNAGVGGAGGTNGLTNGQLFFGHTTPKIVVNTCGKVGIGTIAPNATLQVNGGVSVGTKIESSNYTMTSADFAVLVNAAAKAVTINLPPASNTGQMVHIKKIDSTTNTVHVSRSGTDTIEGAVSKTLSSRFNSLTLLAGGNGSWYILSNAT
jgi:hypothetical protein